MSRRVHLVHRARQRGAGVLPVALILLAGAALVLLFAQRNLLLDWRITQQGYSHRLAYAAADRPTIFCAIGEACEVHINPAKAPLINNRIIT